MKLAVASRSHRGIVRTENQDHLYEAAAKGLFAVADGMGGLEGGGLAARKAVSALDAQGIPPACRRATEELGSIEAFFGAVYTSAEKSIREEQERLHSRGEMGTTLVILLLRDTGYYVANIGDSRAYLLRDGRLLCLTKDHSYVQERIDEGTLDRSQAHRHPESNIISRFIGSGENAKPDVFYGAVREMDLYLLMSDGILAHLTEENIRDIAAAADAIVEIPQALIEAANARGGEDNSTVVAVRTTGVQRSDNQARTLMREIVRPNPCGRGNPRLPEGAGG